ncbi:MULTISPECIES: CcdB family protein [Caballeronia]|jgi:toxin CcdB|uniref:Toxin CcdB n=3 Tax=Caballeronia TaxID=1827195 RepID=A0AA37I8Q3_9BURK|nr:MULTISPECIES: CcdB family protein [Caballeronia]MBC8639920.1 CcdB family protein [Caballeronia sp. EK]GJH20901.1 CcdB family protein [Caballeronia novacaledonica]GJH25420.1 CcdB family protein [Caballeronia novacaledonica]
MARFDLYINPNEDSRKSTPYVVDLQSDHVGSLPTRVVIPLRRSKVLGYSGTPSDLLPSFVIDGEDCFLDTPAMAAIPAGALGKRIGSLAEFRGLIADARDRLFGGY